MRDGMSGEVTSRQPDSQAMATDGSSEAAMEPPVLLAREASVDANSGRTLVPTSGSVTVRQKTVTSGDLAVYLQFIFMDRSAYIWAGLDGEFGNLAVAIPPKFVRWLHSRSCCTLFACTLAALTLFLHTVCVGATELPCAGCAVATR